MKKELLFKDLKRWSLLLLCFLISILETEASNAIFDYSFETTNTIQAIGGPEAGSIQIAGTTDTATSICVGEGTDDLIAVEFVDPNVLNGTNSTYVITDNATGNILGLPAAGPFNLEGAPTGVCDIWYLRYENGLTGLAVGQNVSGLVGIYDFSNAISVTRSAVNGGEIQIAGTTDTATSICVGEGTDDLIAVEFTMASTTSGTNGTYVITDNATGNILGLPAAGPFNLEGAPTGVCDIWYLRYEDGLTGLTVGQNISNLVGCYDFSNAISVTRSAVNGGEIQIAGTTDTTTSICVGEGTDDLIAVEFTMASTTSGTNGTYVITDNATGNILGLPAAGPFNLEGAPTGVCDIWYLRYEDGLTGLAVGQNVSNLVGCYDFSNAISVTRSAVNGGEIQIAGTTDTVTSICVGEGTDDLIAVEFTMASTTSGTNGTYVITDNATGNILGLPAAGPFNLEGAPTGVCDIWYLRYEDGLTGLTVGQNISNLVGCYDFSNAISVTRSAVNGGEIQIAGTTDTATSICVGEGTDDLIAVEFTMASTTSGTNGTYVITDNATGNILGLPAAGPFNLEGAPTGVCDIWYLRYEDGLTGLAVGQNVSNLVGCYDFSNAISVTRSAVNAGGIEITGTGETATSICVDGVADPIAVTMTGMSSGSNSGWLITDTATGQILGLPAAGPFDLDGAGAGECSIWYIAYETGLTGLTVGQNVSGLMGCYDLSNEIVVTRNAPDGGEIQIAGTTDTATSICVGEGTDDLIAVEFTMASTTSGTNGTYVITDNATGNILGLPAAGPFNLEGAPTGVCDIWYLRYEDGLTGLAVGQNVSNLVGCYDFSNAISVTRSAVNGGEIQIAGTTDTATSICVGEGTDDLIAVEFTMASTTSGTNGTYVITDNATGNILGLPAAGPFNLEGAPTGVCDIWYLRYEDGLTGLTVGQNVSNLVGCYDFSNAISVTRSAVNGGEIQIAGTTDTATSICVGEGTDDLIAVEFTMASTTSGTNGTYVITDNATGNILGLPAAGPFNLEGAPSGVCDIWYLRYEDGLTGLTVGQNVSNLVGCYDFSNAISVTRSAVNGGEIQIAGTTDTTTSICVGEGTDDLIAVEFTMASTTSGTNGTYVITDNATGNILGLPAAGPFNLEGAPTGVCDIWYLRYEDGLTGLTVGQNVSNLVGCYDFSNAISVTRSAVNGGEIQIAGTTDTTTSICVGEGTDDLIAVEFTMASTTSGTNGTYVITDNATGNILGLPAAGPFNLEGAPTGVCDIWYLRYEDGLTGLAVGQNVSNLVGCYDFSNAISVTRSAVNGGEIQIAGTTDTATSICVGEGTDDLIAVEFTMASTTSGTNGTYVITDNATGNILGLPAAGPFNLEGAPTGVCDIWYLRYEDGLTGLAVGQNVSNLVGCYDFSNAISVTRSAVNGGEIQIAGTTDTATSICVGEGIDDLIAVEFTVASVTSGTNGTYVITDNATGNILGLPAAGPFNLEGAPAGVCDIWYLRYETGLTGLAMGMNISGLSGCFDLSNAISVTRLTGTDCDVLSVDDFAADFNFSVYPNPTSDSVNIKYNGNRNLTLDVQIIDMLGKQISNITLSTENNMTLDLSRLTNGTYFLNILDNSSGNRIVKRVIKN
ncbi:T9SS type A sorting domain-containing protein [uncultured Lacinutrix sp.]|uniref:T9SS type A sorting domain-containing protein n=1 Tax=uncultured Lacinutrix sp. TaxID=574032 RepID=UPI00260843BB|nr:T9SS type A sorting domain-containing protein [uncultured Lacinutrix sp.]